MKTFIIKIIKLTQNNYRKVRFYSTLLMMAVFKLIFEEYVNVKKLYSQKTKRKTGTLDSFAGTKSVEDVNRSNLEFKLDILEELIKSLKETFIYKKVSDVSKNIRSIICDYIFKISKKYFVELFDSKLVSFYPFFLVDSHGAIKAKYLQLIYDNIEKDDPETNNTIIEILKKAKDAILNICVKEDKGIAKQAIRIIELLGQDKILENKTVDSLVPHLFNPQPQIRNLISKVIINYKLNFEISGENEIELNDEDNEDEEDKNESKKDVKKIERKIILTLDNLLYLLEIFFKLGDNEEKMIKILVDDFYPSLVIFKDFSLFFEMIDLLIDDIIDKPSQKPFETNLDSETLLKTCLLVLNYSVQQLQNDIELASSSADEESRISELIPKNEEFVNLIINKIPIFIKKIRVGNNVEELFYELLNLFENLKIFNQNLVKFNENTLLEIINELINSFFVTLQVSFIKDENNNKDYYRKLIKNILKSIYLIQNNANFISFSNFQARCNKLINHELCDKFSDLLHNQLLNNPIITKFLSSGESENITFELFDTIYILFNQFNYMLYFYKDSILFSLKKISFTLVNQLITGLVFLIYKKAELNNKDNSKVSNYRFYSFSLIAIKLLKSVHHTQFSELLSNNNHIETIDYIQVRDNMVDFLFKIANNFEFKAYNISKEGSQETSRNTKKIIKEFNNNLLKIKTRAVGTILEMLILMSSEKILDNSLKYSISETFTQNLEIFIVNNFIKFYVNYNIFINNNNEKENQKDAEKFFTNEELAVKTECFKKINSKFSKLILLNLGIFKYTNLCCLYFESFYVIKLPVVIENLNFYIYEALLEKEINYFKLNIDNKENMISILAFYLTKIIMRIFNNKSILNLKQEQEEEKLETENSENKMDMISRVSLYYFKTLKKIKSKLAVKEQDVYFKDKMFFEKFIFNSINFSLSVKRQEEEIINRTIIASDNLNIESESIEDKVDKVEEMK